MNRAGEDQAHAQNCACWAGEIRGKQVAELHTYLYIKGTIAQQIHNEFASDLIIKLVPGNQARAGLKNPRATPSIADVKVSSKVSIKEVYGVNRQTGKPGKMVAVVFEATITSQVPPALYTVSESDHILQNVEVFKRFTKQVKQVIVKKISPNIPAN